MAKIDLDDLKRQIMALTASSVTREPHAEKLRALSLQRRKTAEQIVSSTLARAGLDITGLREKLAQNDRTFRDEVERLRVPQAETIAARKTAFQKNVASRRAALEKIGRRGVVGPVSSHIVNLPEPIYIGETIPPVDPLPSFLKDSSISPGDSRARIYIFTDVGFSTTGFSAYYGPSFDFWYVWSSDSSLPSYVTITAPLVYSGTVHLYLVGAELYWVWNRLDFDIYSALTVYQKNGTDQGFYTSPVVKPMYLATYPFSDDSKDVPLEYQYHFVQIPYVVVPPNGTILIRASAIFHWEFRNGWGPDDREPGNEVRCDFANKELDYFVQSPGVTIEVTGPIVGDPTH